ncbi:hypothetical protein HYW41_05280 [Candidatus Daviesbacteria bacterium]|nr:hypothetical protein [Candidatus Daviesbacteria bacterium]
MAIRTGSVGQEGLDAVNQALREYGADYAAAYLLQHQEVRKAGYQGYGEVFDALGLTGDYINTVLSATRADIAQAGYGSITSAAEIRRQPFQPVPPLATSEQMVAAIKKYAPDGITYYVREDFDPTRADSFIFARVFRNGDAGISIIRTTGKNPDPRIPISQASYYLQAILYGLQGRIPDALGATGMASLYGKVIAGSDLGEGWFFGSCADASERLARYTDALVGSTTDEATQLSRLTETLVNNSLANSSDFGPRTGLEWIPSASLVAFGAKNVPLYIANLLSVSVRAEVDRRGIKEPEQVFNQLSSMIPSAQ